MKIEWKTDKEMLDIIETRKPRGLFVCLNDCGFKGYTAVDNSTGEAWTEDFEDLKSAEVWLRIDISR